jgi:hypothetical protein
MTTTDNETLLKAIDGLDVEEAQDVLRMVVAAIVSKEAGNTMCPFAWMPTKKWLEIERAIMNIGRSDKADDQLRISNDVLGTIHSRRGDCHYD